MFNPSTNKLMTSRDVVWVKQPVMDIGDINSVSECSNEGESDGE